MTELFPTLAFSYQLLRLFCLLRALRSQTVGLDAAYGGQLAVASSGSGSGSGSSGSRVRSAAGRVDCVAALFARARTTGYLPPPPFLLPFMFASGGVGPLPPVPSLAS